MKLLSFELSLEEDGKVPVQYRTHLPFLELESANFDIIGTMLKRAFREIDLKTGPVSLNDLKVKVTFEDSEKLSSSSMGERLPD